MTNKPLRSRSIIEQNIESAQDIVKSILEDLEVDQPTEKQIQDLLERYRFHMEIAYSSQMRYRFWAIVFSLITPLLVAGTVLTTSLDANKRYIIFFSVATSVVTALDATYKFSANFEKCANMLIRLRDQSVDLQIGLKKVQRTSDIQSKDDRISRIDELLLKQNKLISDIGATYASFVVPSKVASKDPK